VHLEGVRLQVELRLEDDELLREAVRVRAQEVVVLVVLLLRDGARERQEERECREKRGGERDARGGRS